MTYDVTSLDNMTDFKLCKGSPHRQEGGNRIPVCVGPPWAIERRTPASTSQRAEHFVLYAARVNFPHFNLFKEINSDTIGYWRSVCRNLLVVCENLDTYDNFSSRTSCGSDF